VLQSSSFAIVGARKATYYGLSAAESIAGDLSRAGVCVVSGMARGIDAAAHRGALTGAGATAAVLGCGVDVVYPKENKRLMDEIIEKGIVLSEFPPGTSPAAGNFPQRNRIIAGLSQGLMVVEAAEKSGSLITADFALEQGRDVFAVPGLVTSPLNRGAHRLIKQGARLVESAFDILEEMGLNNCFSTSENNILAEKPKITVNDLTSDERRIYNITSDIPISSEVIIQKSGSSAGDVLSILLTMELKGLITQLPGQLYARRGESVRF
ncbi:MAG TPA: DNA-processing protein DprA, partial [Desulfobacteria bacterium]|nr:DNA-processing protein DprA [Desulfobacteria bacterium]